MVSTHDIASNSPDVKVKFPLINEKEPLRIGKLKIVDDQVYKIYPKELDKHIEALCKNFIKELI